LHLEARAGEFVRLSVRDTGRGISPEDMPRIFEPFFTTKELGKGTGLGLATVSGIVKESGGRIRVYSESGYGTTFRIYLPLADAPPAPATPSTPSTAPAGAGETILVADDDEPVRRVVALELRRIGYEVLEASTGDEALVRAREHRAPIHVLLADMIMPGMNGRALAEAIRLSHPETRVLYTSGYSAEILSVEDIQQPAFAYLEKPFSVAELARALRTLLDSHATSGGEGTGE
jgi:CheY-like chemotaxis protein